MDNDNETQEQTSERDGKQFNRLLSLIKVLLIYHAASSLIGLFSVLAVMNVGYGSYRDDFSFWAILSALSLFFNCLLTYLFFSRKRIFPKLYQGWLFIVFILNIITSAIPGTKFDFIGITTKLLMIILAYKCFSDEQATDETFIND